MSSTVDELRRRVVRDELPLLSMLTADPLKMQSSHLSFQEVSRPPPAPVPASHSLASANRAASNATVRTCVRD